MIRKKVKVMMAVLGCGVMLCACQQSETNQPTTANEPTTVTETTTVTELTTVTEPAQETQVYDADNLFSITLLPEMEQIDMPILQNQFVMSIFEGNEMYDNLEAVTIGIKKSFLQGEKNGNINSLESFAEYVDDYLSGNGMTLSWDGPAEEEQMEGMLRCIAKDGKVSQENASANMAAKYAETENMYFTVILIGKTKQIDLAKTVVAFHELEGGLGQEKGTLDFVYAMTAVLDRINGSNTLSSAKKVYDLMETTLQSTDDEAMKQEYQKNLEVFQNSAKKNLEDNWTVTDRTSLEEMKKWLIEEGHNKEALEMLTELGVGQDMSREELEEKMKQDGFDDTEKIFTLAAYDARAAYGDDAIKAWDLSRVPTILEMGYAAGYYTYEETLDGILDAAIVMQQTFDSWENFNQSYLYGYSFWAEESLDDSTSSAYERKESVKTMEEETNGIFTVDFKLELTKEW